MLSVVNNALIFALTIICIDGQTDFEMPSKAAQQVTEKTQETGNFLGMEGQLTIIWHAATIFTSD